MRALGAALTLAASLSVGCGAAPVYRGRGIVCRGPSGVPVSVDRAGTAPVGSRPPATEAPPASGAAQDLLREVERWYGTPYVYGGTTMSGTDCSGFTQSLYRSIGVEIPRRASRQAVAARHVSRGNLRAGDLVFFNTSGPGISHVGIYLGDNYFAHAAASRGVVRESLSHPYYTARFVQGGRFLD